MDWSNKFDETTRPQITRREFLAGGTILATGTAVSAPNALGVLTDPNDLPFAFPLPRETRSTSMTIVCIIRYEIGPFQRDAFKEYAQNWGRIIPRCGGRLIGYFLPWQGTNYVAWGLIAFDSLASYEAYQKKLRADPEGQKNFAFAQSKRCILREERNFVEVVDGTFDLAVAMA